MRAILLPIKPKYVELIFKGEKIFEYRKKKPTSDINKIVIYETSPKKRIVGMADVVEVLQNSPDIIWETTNLKGGISKKDYASYFSSKDLAFAFVLTNIRKFQKEIELSMLGISYVPQSFVYLSDEKLRMVEDFSN